MLLLRPMAGEEVHHRAKDWSLAWIYSHEIRLCSGEYAMAGL
jgi:hypothetical protein